MGGPVGRKVKFKDALVFNPHITFLNKDAWDTVGRYFCLRFVLLWLLKKGWGYPIVNSLDPNDPDTEVPFKLLNRTMSEGEPVLEPTDV